MFTIWQASKLISQLFGKSLLVCQGASNGVRHLACDHFKNPLVILSEGVTMS